MNDLRTFPLNHCDLCGTAKLIYICESGHGRMYCKECLAATERIGSHRLEFKAKCKEPECSFIPLNPKKE